MTRYYIDKDGKAKKYESQYQNTNTNSTTTKTKTTSSAPKVTVESSSNNKTTTKKTTTANDVINSKYVKGLLLSNPIIGAGVKTTADFIDNNILKGDEKWYNNFIQKADSWDSKHPVKSTAKIVGGTLGDITANTVEGFVQDVEGTTDWFDYTMASGTEKNAKRTLEIYKKLGMTERAKKLEEMLNDKSGNIKFSPEWWNNRGDYDTTGFIFNEDGNGMFTKDMIYSSYLPVVEKIYGKDSKEYKATLELVKENYNPNAKGWTEVLEDNSVAGSTTDNVMQGVGQVAAQAGKSYIASKGLGKVTGVDTTIPENYETMQKVTSPFNSFTSAYGNARSEAIRNGASEKDAKKAAIVSGIAEAVSEQFFDGMPGTKTAGWGDKFVNKFASKLEKILGEGSGELIEKVLGDYLGEGFEEVASNLITTLANDLIKKYIDEGYSYQTEDLTGNIGEDLLNSFTSEETWEAFFTAALTSAISNAATGAGNNYIDAKRKNQIIENYAEARGIAVKEAEDELNQIQNKTNQVTNTTNAINTTQNQESTTIALQQEQNIINRQIEASQQAYSKLNEELVAKQEKLAKTTENSVKQELQKEVQNLTKQINNLANEINSLNDSAKSIDNALIVESQIKLPKTTITNTKSTPQQIISNAYDSIKVQNMNITPSMQAVIEASANRGVNIQLTDNLGESNAKWVTNKDGSRTILLSKEGLKNFRVEHLFAHEMFHDLSQTSEGKAIIRDTMNFMKKSLGQNTFQTIWNDAYETYKSDYQNSGNIDSLIQEEITAEYIASNLGNLEFVQQLVNEKPSLAKRIYNKVVNLLNKLTGKGHTREKAYWESVKRNFEIAYNKQYESSSTNEKNSLVGTKANLNLIEKGKLKLAEKLKEKKLKDKYIWAMTGWEKSKVDGKWRYEINDSKLKKDIDFNSKETFTLGEVVDSPKLFRLYPELKNYLFEIGDFKKYGKETVRGFYRNSIKLVAINEKLSEAERNSTLNHELQHCIQNIEGFAKGGTIAFFKEGSELMNVYLSDDQARNIYNKTAGEVESRNVQRRAKLPGILKKIAPPSTTQDVKVKDVVTSEEMAYYLKKNGLTFDNHSEMQEDIKDYTELKNEYNNIKNQLEAKLKQYDKAKTFEQEASISEDITSLTKQLEKIKKQINKTDTSKVILPGGIELTTSKKYNPNQKYSKNIESLQNIDNTTKYSISEGTATHYGNLGKGRDTYYSRMTGSRRNTGHFGTGTYFMSNEAANKNDNSNYGYKSGGRPRNDVDISGYNLYTPQTNQEAFDLHDGLKQLNNNFEYINKTVTDGITTLDEMLNQYEKYGDEFYLEEMANLLEKNGYDLTNEKQLIKDGYYYDASKTIVNYAERLISDIEIANRDFNTMKDLLIRNGITEEQINKALEDVKNARNSYKNSSYDAKEDSLSTVFMKSLGFEGVDVRNLDMLDNSTYGTVVYDLKTQNDSKYSISNTDSQGRTLSNEQMEYFKDTKAVDENGNLKVMYHGASNGTRTILKGGTYYTANKEYADGYQNPSASSITSSNQKTVDNPKTYEVYLNITNPFTLTNKKAKEIYINEYIKGGNSLYFDPYTDYTETINNMDEIDWTEGEDLRDWLQENHPEYDGLYLDEGGDGGYGEAEYRWRGISVVPFNSNQIKNVDNTNPTTNEDIRYSKTIKSLQKYTSKEDLSGNPKEYIYIAPISEYKVPSEKKINNVVITPNTNKIKVKRALKTTMNSKDGTLKPYIHTSEGTLVKINGEDFVAIKDDLADDKWVIIDPNSGLSVSRLQKTKKEAVAQATKLLNEKIDSGITINKLRESMFESMRKAGFTEKQISELQNQDISRQKTKTLPNKTKEQPVVKPVNEVKNEPKSLPLEKENKTPTLTIKAEDIAKQINGVAKTEIDKKQRKWIETSTESDALKDKILIKDLDQDKIDYEVQSNQKSLNEANDLMSKMGYDGAVQYVKSIMDSGKTPSASEVTMMQLVLQASIKNQDYKLAQDLTMDIAIMGTDLGQAVQALSMIKKLTPEGQLKMYEKIIKRAKLRGDKSFDGVEVTTEMVEDILSAYNEDGTYDQAKLDEGVEKFKQKVSEQMKTTLGEKIDAWRYLSMLGNPKTHIRNIVSNISMKGTVKVKNAIARTVETGVSKILPGMERTKTWKKTSKTVKDFSRQMAIEYKDTISGESKYNEEQELKRNRQTFKFKPLEKINTFNSNALEVEDWFFSKSEFVSRLQEYLTANGIETQEDIDSNPKIIQKGINYAIEQAQIATFRQYSKLASEINRIERTGNKVTKLAIKSVLPFKKTPINVAKAGFNYSPLGLLKNVSYDVMQVSKGNMNASQFIDNLSQGITGTSLTLLGYALAKAGLLNGAGGDDKDDEYDKSMGKQTYSINIGGKTYSISWLSPTAMPLLVGATAFEQLEEQDEWDMNIVTDMLANTINPITEMSFISGLTDTLSKFSSNTSEAISDMVNNAIESYVLQFIPTLFSQIASTMDDKKRSTKASANSKWSTLESLIRKTMLKIPGARNLLEPQLDVWGNEIEQDVINRSIETYIAPYNSKEYNIDDISKEIKEVYNKTGESTSLPSTKQAYVTYGDKTYRMSAKEYTQYKKTYGQTANELIGQLIERNDYNDLSYDKKASVLTTAYEYSTYKANQEYFKNIEGITYTNETYDKYDAYVKEGGDVNDYILYRKAIGEMESDKDKDGNPISGSKKIKVVNYINSMNISTDLKEYLYNQEYASKTKKYKIKNGKVVLND